MYVFHHAPFQPEVLAYQHGQLSIVHDAYDKVGLVDEADERWRDKVLLSIALTGDVGADYMNGSGSGRTWADVEFSW